MYHLRCPLRAVPASWAARPSSVAVQFRESKLPNQPGHVVQRGHGDVGASTARTRASSSAASAAGPAPGAGAAGKTRGQWFKITWHGPDGNAGRRHLTG